MKTTDKQQLKAEINQISDHEFETVQLVDGEFWISRKMLYNLAYAMAMKFAKSYQMEVEELVGQSVLVMMACLEKINPEGGHPSKFLSTKIYWGLTDFMVSMKSSKVNSTVILKFKKWAKEHDLSLEDAVYVYPLRKNLPALAIEISNDEREAIKAKPEKRMDSLSSEMLDELKSLGLYANEIDDIRTWSENGGVGSIPHVEKILVLRKFKHDA